MRNTIRKTVSLLLAVFMVTVLFVSVSADDNEYENENERYENEAPSQNDDSYEDDGDYEDDEDYEGDDDREQAGTGEETRFYLADYYAGTKLDLEQYLGKVVVINYFTEWCPYCMDEMPDFKKVLDTYDPEQFVVLLIHPWDGEDASNSASVVERFGLEAATVIEDEDFALVDAIGVPGYPTTVIVDQEGYISYAVASRTDFESISEVLDALGVETSGKAPSYFAVAQPSFVLKQLAFVSAVSAAL